MKVMHRLSLSAVMGVLALASTLPISAQTVQTTIEKRTIVAPVSGLEPGVSTVTTTVERTTSPGTTYTTTTPITTLDATVPAITTVKTTSSPRFSFVPGHNYIVVDPITGALRGPLDTATYLYNGQKLSAGLLLVDQLSNDVIATVNSSGDIVALGVYPVAEPLTLTLNTRRGELLRLLNEGLTRGDITAAKAEAFRLRLDQIASDELAARSSGGVYTYAEALAIADALNSLRNEMATYVSLTTLTPLVGIKYVTSNGNLVVTRSGGTDVDYRRLTLERRIDDEYKAGRLSARYVAELKDSLNSVKQYQTKYTRDGRLSSDRLKSISEKLDRVQTKLDRCVANINDKRARIGIRVD